MHPAPRNRTGVQSASRGHSERVGWPLRAGREIPAEYVRGVQGVGLEILQVVRSNMPHRILFVDDEAPIRELLTLFFKKKGIEVATAVSTSEGLELSRGGSYDLAIVDVNLAGENGLELMVHLKREHPAMPVIIFTGLTGDDNLLKEALARGADGFMRKTEPLAALYDEVRRHLPQ